MSVIVWDGKTLAADKQTNYGRSCILTRKIERAKNGHLLGWVGVHSVGKTMVNWYNNGRPSISHPNRGLSSDDDAQLIAITPDGVFIYEGTADPYQPETPYIVLGSGSSFAYAALFAGADARRAVEITNQLCDSCGLGIDTLTPDWVDLKAPTGSPTTREQTAKMYSDRAKEEGIELYDEEERRWYL